MKPPSDDKSCQCIVVGGGALGLLLTNALSQSVEGKSAEPDVRVANRRRLPKVVISNVVSGQEHVLKVPVSDDPPDALLRQPLIAGASTLSIFFCVPPETTEQVFKEWLNAVETLQSSASVEFIFCNNGLLSPHIRKLVEENSGKYQFVRAIFFAGAVRSFENEVCRVTWNGGHLVRWGKLTEKNDADAKENEDKTSHWSFGWMKVQPDGNGAVGFLRWRFAENLDRLEREKFYTNFMLGAIIGPRMEINKSILSKTSVSERALIARQFEILWAGSTVTESSLQQTLLATVEATAENINSLSLQGAKGSGATMEYFFRIIEEQILAHTQPKQFDVLAQLLQSARKQWGLCA
jgi:hypothetical protein